LFELIIDLGSDGGAIKCASGHGPSFGRHRAAEL
jgi:hypothetical protein